MCVGKTSQLRGWQGDGGREGVAKKGVGGLKKQQTVTGTELGLC